MTYMSVKGQLKTFASRVKKDCIPNQMNNLKKITTRDVLAMFHSYVKLVLASNFVHT